MNRTDFFQRLDAPLVNPNWSWGAVRESDGLVFLCVWQDEEREHQGRFLMRLTNKSTTVGSLGYAERCRHLELVRRGSPCYLVLCRSRSAGNAKRRSGPLDPKDVFIGGSLIELDGDVWIERRSRVGTEAVMPSDPRV